MGFFRILQKEDIFHLLYQLSALEGSLTMQPRFYHPLKISSSPIQFGQEENIHGHSFERRTYRFVLKITWVFPIPRGRVERE